MFNYKLIIEYYQKGNNHSEIASICGCSRMTVIKVLKRVEELEVDNFIDTILAIIEKNKL